MGAKETTMAQIDQQAAREAYLAHGHYLTASNHAAEAARLHTRHFGQK